MDEMESNISAEGAAEAALPEDRLFNVAEAWLTQLTLDRTPDQVLADSAQSSLAFAVGRGLTTADAAAWAWVLESGVDLPVGWSTPGAEPAVATAADEHFRSVAEPGPTLLTTADGRRMLVLPIHGEPEPGRRSVAALLVVAVADDAELDQNTEIGFVFANRITTIQIHQSVATRVTDRSLALAQAAAQIQSQLAEPTSMVEAVAIVCRQLETCEHLVQVSVEAVIEGELTNVDGFGEPLEEDPGQQPGLRHAEVEQLLLESSGSFPVKVGEEQLGVIDVRSRSPLADVERRMLESIATAIAGTVVRHRATDTIESLRRSATRRLVEAQERERSLIAADIHDGVLQQLGATAIRLELAQSRVEQNDLDTAGAIIADGTREIRACARELRSLLMELRPQVLDDNGLNSALNELGRLVTEVKVDVTSDVPEDLGSEFSITIFRIVQEALTNIQKHAQAEHAEVSVTLRDDAVAIDITDDGIGYERAATGPSSEGSHFGLLGMRERAQMFGGTFKISGKSGHGTEIHATLPLDGRPDDEV